MPTKARYEQLQGIMGNEALNVGNEALNVEYEALKVEYEALKVEYEHIRRYFNNPLKLTEVLSFSQDSHVSRKFDHDTIKPIPLCETLIRTTTRPKDKVFIPFCGSGSECVAAANTGRNFVSYDINAKYVKMAQKRVSKALKQPKLFYV
jgi:site-specific DNA-methyltransferase (adenine-specific)